MKITTDIKSITVTQANLARALGLTPARVNQLIDLEVVVRDEADKSGGVKLFESIRNYYQTKQTTKNAAVDDDGETVNYLTEKAKHEKVKRQRAELQLEKDRARAYDAETVERVMIEQLVTLRTQLLGLSSKLAPQIEHKDKAIIADVINREIEEALTQLSEYDPTLFRGDEIKEDEACISSINGNSC